MKQDVFDAICYIPTFKQAGHNVFTKKISFEVALFLWIDQVTTPYTPKINDGIGIPMSNDETIFGSVVEYDMDNNWWWTYLYQSPKWLRIQSAKSIEKWTLVQFLNYVNQYLVDVFTDSDHYEWLQRWKKLFEIILRCGLKKRRHLMSINQHFTINNNGYLIDPKTRNYLLSLDNYIIDSDDIELPAISCMSCAEYVWRELRNKDDDIYDILLDECDQFEAYAWSDVLRQWIAWLATHGLEVFEIQKNELSRWFAHWDFKDEYIPVKN